MNPQSQHLIVIRRSPVSTAISAANVMFAEYQAFCRGPMSREGRIGSGPAEGGFTECPSVFSIKERLIKTVERLAALAGLTFGFRGKEHAFE